MFGVKKIIHFRGSHFDINFKNFTLLSKKIIKYFCRYVDCAIVQSKCLKGQFNGLIQKDKIKVIPNTVDDTFISLNKKVLSKNPIVLFFWSSY